MSHVLKMPGNTETASLIHVSPSLGHPRAAGQVVLFPGDCVSHLNMLIFLVLLPPASCITPKALPQLSALIHEPYSVLIPEEKGSP